MKKNIVYIPCPFCDRMINEERFLRYLTNDKIKFKKLMKSKKCPICKV